MTGAIIGLTAVTVTALAFPAALAVVSGAAGMGALFSGYYQADKKRDQMGREYMEAEFISQQMQAQMKGKSKGFDLADLFSGQDKAKPVAPAVQANDNQVSMADINAMTERLQEGRKSAVQRVAETQNPAPETGR
jgi:Flp pilus assembly protein TadB